MISPGIRVILSVFAISSIPHAEAQLIPDGLDTFASFGSILPLNGSSAGTLQNDGETLGPITGQFRDMAPFFSPTANPDYQGNISVSFSYSEPTIIPASVEVFASPFSIRVASSAGAFTSPDDWTLSMTFDFTGIGSGYLPSGSTFGLLDLDGNPINGPVSSQLPSVRAYDEADNLITLPWLSGFQYLDAGTLDPGSGQPSPVYPVDYAAHTEAGGVYSFVSAPRATDTTLITAATTGNISRIEIDYFGAALENTQFLFGGPIEAVPEPSGALLLGATGMLILLRRRHPGVAA